MASEMMEVAGLSRPFTLGMLYDARRDELIPGLTLWDHENLKKHTVEVQQHSSAFQVSASDSIESKSSLLDVEASLKVSFMSGLISVEGSAEYLNDTKKYKDQSRVVLQYKATTNFKQLSMTDLANMSEQQMDVIQKSSATHVVTGITYGTNAFFVFDSEKLEASSVQNIEGSMEAVIKKIPLLDVEGKAEIKLTDEEKALTKKFSCKFYGDFILKSNPATFEEAVKTYVELPTLLGEHEENCVPVKVWLMPLKNFTPKAAEWKREISAGLVTKAQDAFEDLRQMKMRCNDSLVDSVVQNFPQIQKELNSFQKLCSNYECNLQQTMENNLLSIRAGQEDESSLEQLFKDRDTSPFSHEKLSKWLDHKEREINVIWSCVEMMEGTQIVENQSELDRKVLAPDVEDALCFVFTSMESADPCLQAMTDYLDSPQLRSTNQEPWYYSDEVLTKMREKAEVVNGLAKALKNNRRFRFLIAAIENEKYEGATIYHYKNGKLVTEDFTRPDITDVKTIRDRRDLIWYATDLTLDPDTANNHIILSDEDKKATYGEKQDYPDNPERFDPEPQVMCKEGLEGRHYWEVEWGNGAKDSVYIAAGYLGIQRKGDSADSVFGYNDKSWCFGKRADLAKFRAYYNNKLWEGPLPFGLNRVGVFLDWPAGTLSFYQVSSNRLSHLHTFEGTFTEPLYLGFWFGFEGTVLRFYTHLNFAE